MNVGFIGCGNMANAIIKGALTSGVLSGNEIYAYDLDTEKLSQCAEDYGINTATDIGSLIENADAVILAVKPNVFEKLLPSVTKKLEDKNPLIISIAAGKTLDFIASLLSYTPSLVRVMPNINAKVSAAMSAYCDNQNISAQQEELVKKLFSAVGKVIKLDESYFPLYGVLAGCAPAYAYLFIDSLARAAVKNGMNKQQALEIAAQTVLGSAKLILEGNEHPWALIDQVCSPGGTTIEGIDSLLSDGFESTVINAVDAAVKKDKLI